MSRVILVLSATGNVGRPLIRQLVARGEPVKAASRGGSDFEGAVGVACDFADPTTWAAAFDGVDCVFVMLPTGFAGATAMQERIIRYAVERRCKIVLQTIVEGYGGAAGDVHASPYLGAERLLATAGVPFVILRLGWFMDNFRTGGDALTFSETAQAFAEVLGRPMEFRATTVNAFTDALVAAGMPREQTAGLVGALEQVEMGAAGDVFHDVERLLRKPPRTIRQYVADNVAIFSA
ncbi:MAG: NAD(P)H-binding protein [Gemmatimonadaceae bacterium]|nr:NAD(P)H-binding protein [Gemmatimonadaceae bacterium]